MTRHSSWIALSVAAAHGALALPQNGGLLSSILAATTTSSAAPTATTASPSPTLGLNDNLPSQAALPPKQAWCPSEIFCAGALLQTLNIAEPYPDSKTIVDKPTVKTSNATVADFNAFYGNGSQQVTVGQVVNFLQTDFKGEGLELKPIEINDTTTPKFLSDVTAIPDSLARAWTAEVDSYWKDLVRTTDQSTLCPGDSGCESSLIPLNHTFVVPGGRFREQYYWDSLWILEGLLASELYDIAKNTLQNFMDELDRFGFIPNGGRIYYLNRSQPPVFIHMLSRYVNATNDKSILSTALPLAEKELAWWKTNRTISIKSPYTNKTHSVSHYAVNNTAPRPESYLEDYNTVNGPGMNYSDDEKAALYAELASGAETGWDYTARWTKDPFATVSNTSDQEPLLRGLNVRNTIPVDLNSILYNADILLADLYTLSGSTKNTGKASSHRKDAAARKAAILDLMWDSEKLAFYDFNLSTGARGTFFSAAHFYPMWNGIWPPEVLKDEKKVQSMFASVGLVLAQYNGTFPATFVTTGAQWDAPNTWPPHQYIVMQALANVPKNVSKSAYPALDSNTTSYSLVPSGQLGLDQSQLPVQTLAAGGTTSGDVAWRNGTWTDGGVVRGQETWSNALLRGMVNRYISSVFCSWYSTGGSIPGLLNQLSPQELNVTHSDPSSTGHMYEKFNLLDLDAAGSGGEYTVQAGFGWTNGVALWVMDNYGELITTPNCPAISITEAASSRRARDAGSRYVGRRVKGPNGRFLVETSHETNTHLLKRGGR